jgi:MoaA/NifB/PqqE/SkfB family radical SAM enzyme
MANAGFRPDDPIKPLSDHFLTFLVPADFGCNLKCQFCVIGQRQEIIENILTPADYADFITDFSVLEPVGSLSIQGYEPLLPASLPHTLSILRTAADLAIPRTLVTNGVYLDRSFRDLVQFELARMGVSLDAARADDHDRLRGVEGAWATTTQGIREAASAFAGTGTRLTVISTHMPRRASYLLEMPKLLRKLSVDDWIINPLLTVGTDRPGKFPGRPAEMLNDFLALQQRARDEGVHLTIDDEFDLLRPSLTDDELEQYAALNVKTLPPGITISRLLPSGHCSVGTDILRKLPPDAPRWRPGRDDPAAFLRSLLHRQARVQKAA